MRLIRKSLEEKIRDDLRLLLPIKVIVSKYKVSEGTASKINSVLKTIEGPGCELYGKHTNNYKDVVELLRNGMLVTWIASHLKLPTKVVNAIRRHSYMDRYPQTNPNKCPTCGQITIQQSPVEVENKERNYIGSSEKELYNAIPILEDLESFASLGIINNPLLIELGERATEYLDSISEDNNND